MSESQKAFYSLLILHLLVHDCDLILNTFLLILVRFIYLFILITCLQRLAALLCGVCGLISTDTYASREHDDKVASWNISGD